MDQVTYSSECRYCGSPRFEMKGELNRSPFISRQLIREVQRESEAKSMLRRSARRRVPPSSPGRLARRWAPTEQSWKRGASPTRNARRWVPPSSPGRSAHRGASSSEPGRKRVAGHPRAVLDKLAPQGAADQSWTTCASQGATDQSWTTCVSLGASTQS